VTLNKERTPEEYRKMIVSVQEDVMQLQQLTRSLLEIAKTGTHGSIDLNEVRVDEVLVKVASDVKKQNLDYNIQLDFGEFPDDERLLDVFGNADLLYSALKNLVENGCKYSEDKTATVSIAYLNKKIEVKINSKGDVIAEADIKNIFEPFFRTGQALSKPGFGLGLTLAKRIISLHKGIIDVTSDPETGTIFTITLPSVLDFK
jgi:signal transduction histidine kinase